MSAAQPKACGVQLRLAERGPFNLRWIARLEDSATVECVLYRGDTLCISSQVGCAVGCVFCASGKRGLTRPLELRELVGQIEAVRAQGHRLARVTLSGVGEPLHNASAALALLGYCQRQRLGLSLTTSGGPLVRLRQWLHAPHNGLTVSMHAGSEATRARLLPHAPALEAVWETLAQEWPRMTGRRRKKTALAYLVLAGDNDSDAELDAFAARAAALGARVHLYAYNPLPRSARPQTPRARFEQIYARLARAGLRVHMSSQARIEANGGCGTLVARSGIRSMRTLHAPQGVNAKQ